MQPGGGAAERVGALAGRGTPELRLEFWYRGKALHYKDRSTVASRGRYITERSADAWRGCCIGMKRVLWPGEDVMDLQQNVGGGMEGRRRWRGKWGGVRVMRCQKESGSNQQIS